MSGTSFSATVKAPLTTSPSCARPCGGVLAKSPPRRAVAQRRADGTLVLGQRGSGGELTDGRGQPVTEQVAQQRDPGRDADLPERGVDTGSHPRLLRADDADRGRGQRWIDQADPDAGHDEARDQVGPPRLVLRRAA